MRVKTGVKASTTTWASALPFTTDSALRIRGESKRRFTLGLPSRGKARPGYQNVRRKGYILRERYRLPLQAEAVGSLQNDAASQPEVSRILGKACLEVVNESLRGAQHPPYCGGRHF